MWPKNQNDDEGDYDDDDDREDSFMHRFSKNLGQTT